MNTSDPVNTPLEPYLTAPPNLAGKRRCQAHSKQSGEQCRRAATPGHNVCVMHGSGSPQARAKARLRLAELVEPAVATFARTMVNPASSDMAKLRAAENVMDRAGFSRTPDISLDESKEMLLQSLLSLKQKDANDGLES